LNQSFIDEIESLQLGVDREFFVDIERYIELLKKWNRVHNLTRMSDNEILSSIIDSITPFKDITFHSLLDIGSGAGFPAIPISILRRDSRVILVEPIKKKSSFLHYVKSSLKLTNVEIYSDRVENLNIESPEIITSRAVTETKTLLELSKNLQKSGTKLLFYKGTNLPTELENLELEYQIINRGNRNYLIIEI
jgi:16S rRNA (guanine527-N7)-methyltransferase